MTCLPEMAGLGIRLSSGYAGGSRLGCDLHPIHGGLMILVQRWEPGRFTRGGTRDVGFLRSIFLFLLSATVVRPRGHHGVAVPDGG